MNNEEVLTPKQAAAELHLAEKTVKDWIRQGRLRGVKMGRWWRILRSDLEAYKRQGGPGAPTPSA